MSEETRAQSAADVNLGRGLFADEHNTGGAIVAWERAIRRDPENAEGHLYLGQVLGEQGQFERAEQLLRRAVTLLERQSVEEERLRTQLAEARNSLGVVLMNVHRHVEALPMFRAVTQELTYNSQHLAWGNLGWAHIEARQFREAVTALERSVSIQARFCVGWARLGHAYYQLNDYGHALGALDHALDASQQGCDRLQGALLDRARVHIQLHQPEPARDDIRRCIELDSATPDGRECEQLGRSVAP